MIKVEITKKELEQAKEVSFLTEMANRGFGGDLEKCLKSLKISEVFEQFRMNWTEKFLKSLQAKEMQTIFEVKKDSEEEYAIAHECGEFLWSVFKIAQYDSEFWKNDREIREKQKESE